MIYICFGIFTFALDVILIKKVKKSVKKKIIIIILSIITGVLLIIGCITESKSDNCCECRDYKDVDICCDCKYPYYDKSYNKR